MVLRALNALKCLSDSADDAGITRTRFVTPDYVAFQRVCADLIHKIKTYAVNGNGSWVNIL